MPEGVKRKTPDTGDPGKEDTKNSDSESEMFTDSCNGNTSYNENKEPSAKNAKINNDNRKEKVPKNDNGLSQNSNNDPNIQKVEVNSTRKINKYNYKDKGPFTVYVESTNGNAGSIHPMKLARMLFGPSKSGSEKIKRIGRNRVEITASSSVEANKLLESEIIKLMKLEAHIPTYKIERQGVAWGVDLEKSEKEILEDVNSHIPITGARRILRRIQKDGEWDMIPTQLVIFTFRGQDLPTHIYMDYVILEILPNIPSVIQCRKCLNFGHLQKVCRGKEKCSICKGDHSQDQCTHNGPPICLHCNRNHQATDQKNCPEWERQRNIKKMMGHYNISYREASEKLPREDKNLYRSSYSAVTSASPLHETYQEQFPIIPQKEPKNTQRNAETTNFSSDSSGHFTPSFRIPPLKLRKEERSNSWKVDPLTMPILKTDYKTPDGIVMNSRNKVTDTFNEDINIERLIELISGEFLDIINEMNSSQGSNPSYNVDINKLKGRVFEACTRRTT